MKKIKRKILTTIVMFSAILVSACALPGLGGNVGGEESIRITSGSVTEYQILGHLIGGMVKHYTDIDVQNITNLATSAVEHQAMIRGDANVGGVRYTGTSLTAELQSEPITDPEKAYAEVTRLFKERHNQKFYPSYGFENTYVFLVKPELAEEYNLEKVSDLEDLSEELRAGFDGSWLDRKGDGYEAFVDIYGFEFEQKSPMQIGLVYDALAAGEMDIVLGYSTDGRIASYDLVALEDDKNVFPPYDASPIATYKIIEEYPVLDDLIMKLTGTISTEAMQEMNYIADNNLVEPQVVAQQFLEENNFFEDKEPYVEPISDEGGLPDE